MNLDLREVVDISSRYKSPSQIARVLTERWVVTHSFCPQCCSSIKQAPNNSRVLDFICETCELTFELKSKRGAIGAKIVDGAYAAMTQAIATGNQPNFFFLDYDKKFVVNNLVLIPKRFITQSIVEKRRPLAATAQRAGWIGCNLIVSMLPKTSMIYYVRDGRVTEKETISAAWRDTAFLEDIRSINRGWTIAVMSCIEDMGKQVFTLDDVYRFVPIFLTQFPNNRNIKPKIRQQLQILRDRNWLRFLGDGVYSLRD